jgi:hypothetical protein
VVTGRFLHCDARTVTSAVGSNQIVAWCCTKPPMTWRRNCVRRPWDPIALNVVGVAQTHESLVIGRGALRRTVGGVATA